VHRISYRSVSLWLLRRGVAWNECRSYRRWVGLVQCRQIQCCRERLAELHGLPARLVTASINCELSPLSAGAALLLSSVNEFLCRSVLAIVTYLRACAGDPPCVCMRSAWCMVCISVCACLCLGACLQVGTATAGLRTVTRAPARAALVETAVRPARRQATVQGRVQPGGTLSRGQRAALHAPPASTAAPPG
jgi:hypothetical protein